VTARLFAWSVHLFTGLGLIASGGIAIAIVRDDLEFAFLLMAAATLIDAIDGTLARAARVSKVLPEFDGRRLDDIIDFQTYTSLPLFLMWRADLVTAPWLALPLLASAYGFCRKQAKTDDGYFLGFPSYWNVVAFYAYFLKPAEPVLAAVVTALAILTFVPLRYLYPSQPGILNRLTVVLAIPWAAMLIAILLFERRGLVWPSLYFPVFYMAASWWVSIHEAKRRKRP
jgi:phosphatidylcholine synthase